MVEFNLSISGLLGSNTARDIVKRILQQFDQEAGPLIVSAVQSVLGTAEIYTLAPDYSKRKPKDKRFIRFPGKADDQPLILTGQLFYSVECRLNGDHLTLELTPNATVRNGTDYGEFFEARTQFLEKGLEIVADQLGDILGRIIMREMGL